MGNIPQAQHFESFTSPNQSIDNENQGTIPSTFEKTGGAGPGAINIIHEFGGNISIKSPLSEIKILDHNTQYKKKESDPFSPMQSQETETG